MTIDRERSDRVWMPPGRWSAKGLALLFLWLIVLPSIVRTAVDLGSPRGWTGLLACVVGLVAFTIGCSCSIRWLLTTGEVPTRQIRPWLAVLVISTAVSIGALGTQGMGMIVYLALLVAFVFPWTITAAVCGAAALFFYLADRFWPSLSDMRGLALAAIAGGAGAAGGRISAQRRHQNELLRRREQELEIADTRNEMARDLHDLLGHSLTAISVKAELAERLIDVDPLRARAELSDVRSLTRSALAEVRATVNDYRDVSLAAEIGRAHQMLDAAQIRHELPGAIDQVPEDLRTLFAWALREGVTNVVRHSGARHCRVELSATSITVTDDGDGVASSSGDSSGGNGIAGLRQRAAEAAAVVRTGPAPEGTPARPGFRLVVGRPEAMESAPGRPHSKDRARETA